MAEPASPEGGSVPLRARIPPSLRDAIDGVARADSKPGAMLTRSDALRVAETPAHSQALGVFLAPLLAPLRGWDIDAPERAHIAGELAAWPMPRGWTKPVAPRRYWYRARLEAPPLRAPGVVGDLDAARMDPAVPDRRSKSA